MFVRHPNHIVVILRKTGNVQNYFGPSKDLDPVAVSTDIPAYIEDQNGNQAFLYGGDRDVKAGVAWFSVGTDVQKDDLIELEDGTILQLNRVTQQQKNFIPQMIQCGWELRQV